MKRVIYLPILFLSIFLSTLSYAQLPMGVLSPPGEGNGIQPILDSNGEFTFYFDVRVVNLELLNGVNCVPITSFNPPQELPLPNGYDTMFLECRVNSHIEVIPIDVFTISNCRNVSPNYYNTSSYRFRHEMTVNFLDQCNGNQNDFYVHVTSRILKSNGDLYPICSHTQSGDIFACDSDWFPQISCDPGDPCIPEDLVISEKSHLLQCGELGPLDPRTTEEEEKELLKEHQNLSLQVSPNPFDQKINIRVNADLEGATIQLFSIDGKLLKSEGNIDLPENSNYRLDTHELPKGIYFLQIQHGSTSIFEKIIKS